MIKNQKILTYLTIIEINNTDGFKHIVILGIFWKLKFNIEKCKVQHIEFQKIKVEYRLSRKELKK